MSAKKPRYIWRGQDRRLLTTLRKKLLQMSRRDDRAAAYAAAHDTTPLLFIQNSADPLYAAAQAIITACEVDLVLKG
jgi:hypothetical protein